MIELYGADGLDMYERSHYAYGEHVAEVEQILSWYDGRGTRLLDLGCGPGLHAIEFARRGFRVTGVDVEPSAVRRASLRSRRTGAGAFFAVKDIGRDSLAALGAFDLVYCMGNVLAHIEKGRLPGAMSRIHAVLRPHGVFLFDLLMTDDPFVRTIQDAAHKIFWRRALDPVSGKIRMDGLFLEFGFVQPFEVWGYTLDEARELVLRSGFDLEAVSDRLDFRGRGPDGKVPFCLNFKARCRED